MEQDFGAAEVAGGGGVADVVVGCVARGCVVVPDDDLAMAIVAKRQLPRMAAVVVLPIAELGMAQVGDGRDCAAYHRSSSTSCLGKRVPGASDQPSAAAREPAGALVAANPNSRAGVSQRICRRSSGVRGSSCST